jgi:hypothetical protein
MRNARDGTTLLLLFPSVKTSFEAIIIAALLFAVCWLLCDQIGK